MAEKHSRFDIRLPWGGHFRAMWPKSATAGELRAARAVLLQTLDWWIEAAEQEPVPVGVSASGHNTSSPPASDGGAK